MMQKLVLFALVALAGCSGKLPLAQSYTPPSGVILPQHPSAVPIGTPNYVIDADAGANIPFDSYGLTTNGVTWYLEWQSDSTTHRYSGDVYCSQRCTQTYIGAGERAYSGRFEVLAPNHFHFEAMTPPGIREHLEFDATQQPVWFSLFFDGQPAINPGNSFSSGGRLAASEVIPFGLVSSNVR